MSDNQKPATPDNTRVTKIVISTDTLPPCPDIHIGGAGKLEDGSTYKPSATPPSDWDEVRKVINADFLMHKGRAESGNTGNKPYNETMCKNYQHALNSLDRLRAASVEQDKMIERLREALEKLRSNTYASDIPKSVRILVDKALQAAKGNG